MSTTEREVLNLTPEQFGEVEGEYGWERVSSKHNRKERMCDIWQIVVKNLGTGKFYTYDREYHSGYYDDDSDLLEVTVLTQVFPRELLTIVYD